MNLQFAPALSRLQRRFSATSRELSRQFRDALIGVLSVAVKVLSQRVRVLHPEDLILLKLDASGLQDLADVEGLLADPPRQLNITRLRQSAARLRLGKRLDKCLREACAKK